MEILATLLAIILLFYTVSISRRLKELENRFRPEGGQPVQASLAAQAPRASTLAVARQDMSSTRQELPPYEPNAIDKFFDWLKEDWLMKLGGLIIILGFAWLTSYAFLNNWIGPVGRITLGLAGGVAFFLLGFWRIRKYVYQGSIFTVIGSAVVLITVFAARHVYDFFTPTSALGIMFISTVLVALIALKWRVQHLALTGLVLAAIAPLLTASPSPNFVSLFWYLTIITLGSMWVVAITRWRPLTLASLIIVILYSLPHIADFRGEWGSLLFFGFLFATIFYIFSLVSLSKLSKPADMKVDLIVSLANGLLLLAWIMAAVPGHLQSLVAIAWMIVFLIGAFLLFRITRAPWAVYVYGGLGVVFLAVATAMELSGPALTIAYTVEAGILLLLTHVLLKREATTSTVGLVFVGPIGLSMPSLLSSAWSHSGFHDDFAVLLVLAVVLLALGYIFHNLREFKDSFMPSLLAAIGSIYVYLIIWLATHASMAADVATMASLIVFTLVGLFMYIFGRMQDRRIPRDYGAVLLALVVLRLLIIDVWQMELTGRIVTFFVVGVLLISTAFIKREKKEHE